MELQVKMQDINRKLRQTTMRLQLSERDKRRAQITLQEVGGMPLNTNMYRAVGTHALSPGYVWPI